MKYVQPIRSLEKIEQMKIILKKRCYRDYFLFVLGINVGLRISDILKLQVKDVADKSHITVNEKKTGKLKMFKINSSLRDEIQSYISNMNTEDYLFSKRNGFTPISRVQAYQILNEAAREVGITDSIGTHTLRKTFSWFLYQKTKDVALLQKLLNHSAPSITLRYIGIEQDQQDEAIESFSL